MNLFDEIITHLPINEVRIKTNLTSESIMERIERGLKPAQVDWQESKFFTFHGSYKDNNFKIHVNSINSDGSDVFPNRTTIGIGFILIPLTMDTSPVFYGKVIKDETGAVIKGHFGIPFPIMALLGVFPLVLFAKLFSRFQEALLVVSLFLVIWSISRLIEFVSERKAILDFLKGLFFDVIKNE
ncbi:MAG: hypothetical protein JNK81_04720 [Anaerolineales bacterium]|nr:hypothetical protein [Anaerolineales bacterium]